MKTRLIHWLAPFLLVGSLAACKMPAGGGAASPTSSPTPTRAEYTQPPQNTPTRAESTRAPSPTPPAWCLVETGGTAGTVYIRRGPGMSFPVVGYATQGERLELTGHTDPAGWAEVRTAGGVMGWFYVPAWCANKLNSKKGE